MITVNDIGIVAKEPKALKEDAYGTPTRWLRVRFRGPNGSGVLYLNVVTTGDTAVAAGELAKGARVRVRGELGSRRFGNGDNVEYVIVVEATAITAEPAAEQAPAKADRRTRS